MGKFKNIYIYIKKFPQNVLSKKTKEIKHILSVVYQTLLAKNCEVNFDTSCSQFLDQTNLDQINFVNSNISNNCCDLIIVIGGDGSLLQVIRDKLDFKAPILGINQGRLGFMADLSVSNIADDLANIIDGEFIEESRSLLQASITDQQQNNSLHTAVNDIVLYNNKIPKLIEFQVFIDQKLVLQPRADGLVIATPTGSTAYALSAGGPILYPDLPVITMLALYPHSLNSRPIVINENSIIELKIINRDPTIEYGLNFDGQNNISLQPQDKILITKHPLATKLIHPLGYDYFNVLRSKLGWN